MKKKNMKFSHRGEVNSGYYKKIYEAAGLKDKQIKYNLLAKNYGKVITILKGISEKEKSQIMQKMSKDEKNNQNPKDLALNLAMCIILNKI